MTRIVQAGCVLLLAFGCDSAGHLGNRPEDSAEACSNGKDDDQDGQSDCMDSACADFCVDAGAQEDASSCGDHDGPDVAVQDLDTVPAPAIAGELLGLRAWLENCGNQDTTGSFTTHYFINDVAVGSETFSEVLVVDELDNTGLEYTFDSPGEYEFAFEVRGVVGDVCPDNNRLETALSVAKP